MNGDSETDKSAKPDQDRFIRTSDIGGDISRLSARSGIIQISAQAIQTMGFVIGGAVLARLLTPSDFGLFAMSATFMVVVTNLRDFGIPMATLQQEELDHSRVSALFWLSLKLSVLLFAGMVLMAPVLSWFYGEKRLTAMTIVLAVGTMAVGATAQHESLLMRRMKFGVLRLIDSVVLVVGMSTGIIMAARGAGYWALICQVVVMELVRSAAIWIACGWRPAPPASKKDDVDIDQLKSYAGHYTLYRALNNLGRHSDRVIVGYLHGPVAAGLYYNAYRWAMFPVLQLFPPLMSVAVSGLSRLQDNSSEFRSAWRKGALPVLSALFPALSFVHLNAGEVVHVLLGDQWTQAAPMFRLFCLAALLTSVERVTKWLYLSQGSMRRQASWGFIYAPAMILAFIIGARWGPNGVAVAFVIATGVLLVPGMHYGLAESHAGWSDIGAVVWRPAAAAILSVVAMALVPKSFAGGADVMHLVARGAMFSLLYIAAWIGLPGGAKAGRDVLRMLSSIREPQALKVRELDAVTRALD